jgi:hypothetical protein
MWHRPSPHRLNAAYSFFVRHLSPWAHIYIIIVSWLTKFAAQQLASEFNIFAVSVTKSSVSNCGIACFDVVPMRVLREPDRAQLVGQAMHALAASTIYTQNVIWKLQIMFKWRNIAMNWK